MIQSLWNKILYYRQDTKNTPFIEAFIASWNFQSLLQNISQPVIFVLGGDGTMLAAINELQDKWLPFYGINLWNKWFLLNNKEFLDFQCVERKYPLLCGNIKIENESQTIFACNEIDIRTGNGRIIDLEIWIDNLLVNFSGDGIIVSTPMGSSWYNQSLGWPLLPHQSNLWIICPKAPLTPKYFSPVIFPLEKTISMTRNSFLCPIEIFKDGKFVTKISKETSLTLHISKGKDISLLVAQSQVENWEKRIYQEQWFQ